MKQAKNEIIKIMLVEDHPLVRQGLKKVLDKESDMSICCEVSNTDDAVRALSDLKPDIIIIDISLEGETDGIELLSAIRKRFGIIKSLVLSMHDEAAYVERAIHAGANGYVTKNDPLETVSSAVRAIMDGEIFLSTKISGKFIKKMISKPANSNDLSFNTLTGRELEILEHIGKGFTTGEISKMLNVSVNTVESHKRHIKEKLDIKKGSDLLKQAIQWASQKVKIL